jgi:long-chain acyl-CoA synthetase
MERSMLAKFLQNRFKEKSDEKLFGKRDPNSEQYIWSSYETIGRKARKLAEFFVKTLDIQEYPSKITSVGMCSDNREEWLIADFAATLCGIVSVGYHLTWPDEEKASIINVTNTQIMVVDYSGLKSYIKVLKNCPNFKLFLCMDEIEENDFTEAERKLILPINNIFETFSEFSGLPFENSIHTVVYSSGTTNQPKGLIVTRIKWLKDAEASNFNRFGKMGISFNALAHAMDRGIIWQAVYSGAAILFSNGGDFSIFLEDCQKVSPGIIVGFPHIWNRLYVEFKNRIRRLYVELLGIPNPNPRVIEVLFEATMEHFKNPLVNEIEAKALDEYSKILGKNLKLIGTGGAFTGVDVINFLHRIYPNTMVIDSYGTTEVPGISSNGNINPDVEVKLIDAPEIGYLTTDKPYPQGEIICRTSDMICEYYGNTELSIKFTKENFRDGWYYTGDIGRLEKERLVLIDRRNNLGETYINGRSVWIPREKVEALFLECSLIKRIHLHTDRAHPWVIAIVELYRVSANDATRTSSDLEYEILCELRKIAKKYESSKSGKKIEKYEIPSAVVVSPYEWTVENGLLTASLKMRRGKIDDLHKSLVDVKFSYFEAYSERKEKMDTLSSSRYFEWCDYHFVCIDINDEKKINEIFSKLSALIQKNREPIREFSRKIEKEENECKDLIDKKKKEIDERRKSGEIKDFKETKQLMDNLYDQLEKIRDKENVVYVETLSIYVKLIYELVKCAENLGEKVPYQITNGIMIMPPPKEGEEPRGGILPGLGFETWKVVCNSCGYLIEWGKEGEGKIRYKCAEEINYFLCEECYNTINKFILESKKKYAELCPPLAEGAHFSKEGKLFLWLWNDKSFKANPFNCIAKEFGF